MNTVYVVVYETESGDHGVEGYWTEAPTDYHLETYFRKNNPDEFDRESRTIFWKVHTLNLLEMPKKAKKVTPQI